MSLNGEYNPDSDGDSGYSSQSNTNRGYHPPHATDIGYTSEPDNSPIESNTFNGPPDVQTPPLSGVGIEETNEHYANPLHAACADGNVDVVQLLLDSGADINGRGEHWDHKTPMATAAYHGHQSVVEILWKRGVLQTAEDECSDALENAIEGGHESIVDFLKSKAPGLVIRNRSWHAAENLTGKEKKNRILNLLFNTVIEREENGIFEIDRALFAAALTRKEDYVDRLLDKRKDIFSAFDHSDTCEILSSSVRVAVVKRDRNIVKKLIEKGSVLLVEKRMLEKSEGQKHKSRKYRPIDRRAPTNCEISKRQNVRWLLDHGFDINQWFDIWESQEMYEAFQCKVFPQSRFESWPSAIRVPSNFLFSFMRSIFQFWV